MRKVFKVGSNRGNARIWIENGTLAKYGFTRGDAIAVDFLASGQIKIYRDMFGAHTVAGRTRNGKQIGIIDINSAELTRHLNGAKRALIEYSDKVLTITPEQI